MCADLSFIRKCLCFGATLKLGGGGIMRVKRAFGRALHERRGMLPPTDNFFKDGLTSPSISPDPVGCLLLLW